MSMHHQQPTLLYQNSVLHAVETPEVVVRVLPSSEMEGEEETKPFDYSQREQWLRAAVLGANDGLVSVSSLMIGVGAVNQSVRAIPVSGLVAGACSMAIGEFVSVYSQLDIQVAQMKREKVQGVKRAEKEMEKLPNPLQAAGASALAFGLDGTLPLIAGSFISQHWVRMGVVSAVSSLGLAGFGVAGALLGGSPMGCSTVGVLLGGWAAMLVTFGVLRLFSIAFRTSVG